MFATDLYFLLSNASEVLIDGKKMVGHWFEDEGDEENHRLIVETEDEHMYSFDNSEEIVYGEDTDDGAWVNEANTAERLYVVAHELTRQPVQPRE